MNDKTNSTDLLSEQDSNRLHELVSDAYPRPKKSIRAEVMAQIEAETDKRRRFHRFLRYGNLAACVVLMVGLLVGIVPRLMNTDTFSAEAEKADNADPVSYSLVDDASAAELDLDKDCRLQEEFEIPNEGINALAEAAADGNLEASQAGAPAIPCSIHDDTYHTFSAALIAFVGEDIFAEWYNSAEAADTCGLPSVRTMVQQLAIVRATFTELTKDLDIVYDMDAVFPEE